MRNSSTAMEGLKDDSVVVGNHFSEQKLYQVKESNVIEERNRMRDNRSSQEFTIARKERMINSLEFTQH